MDRNDSPPEIPTRLAAIEETLRPRNLAEKVRTFVLPERWCSTIELALTEENSPENVSNRYEQMELLAYELGTIVASDGHTFAELLSDMVTHDGRLWSFGRGLAVATDHSEDVWSRLVGRLAEIPENQRQISILCGFLFGLNKNKPDLVSRFLDDAVENPTLGPCFPRLQASVGIDARGVDRQ
jgi:hypothetical protein